MIKKSSHQDQVLHRLKIARGHLDKVISMVESDQYCIDIIHQSQAVQSALKKTDHVILENHLNTCVVENMKQGQVAKSIGEIMEVVKRSD